MNCTNCGKPQDRNGQWWRLNNYFGFTGLFCPNCYDMISHDAYGKPNHPLGCEIIKFILPENKHG